MHKQFLDEPMLTMQERAAVNAGKWFSTLSPSLRHDLLRRASVRRFRDGQVICMRGDAALEWSAVAAGTVRVSGMTPGGRQTTLTYAQAGSWIGDVGIFDGGVRTHDATAHGPTTLLQVARADLREILVLHVELYEALLRLNAARLRRMFRKVEELATLPLRKRLALQLETLARRHGVAEPGGDGDEVRIGLTLPQEELARLLGASRQRVNQELKVLERESLVRIRPGALVVRSTQALSQRVLAD
jgi:CRP/FNR family cyclic AMP-dependent transcriptional regulator